MVKESNIKEIYKYILNVCRYKFQPIQRYKALSAEEAEEEFNKRNKHLNYFSLMLRKRLKGDEDTELEEGEEKAKKGSSKKDKGKLEFFCFK